MSQNFGKIMRVVFLRYVPPPGGGQTKSLSIQKYEKSQEQYPY